MSEDKCKTIIRDALVNGNKVQYPISIYISKTGVNLLDFMNEFIADNADLDIIFLRDNSLGYWCLK
jgi:hypothetical protein